MKIIRSKFKSKSNVNEVISLQFMHDKDITDCWLIKRLRFTQKCLRQDNGVAKYFNVLSAIELLVLEVSCMSILVPIVYGLCTLGGSKRPRLWQPGSA